MKFLPQEHQQKFFQYIDAFKARQSISGYFKEFEVQDYKDVDYPWDVKVFYREPSDRPSSSMHTHIKMVYYFTIDISVIEHTLTAEINRLLIEKFGKYNSRLLAVKVKRGCLIVEVAITFYELYQTDPQLMNLAILGVRDVIWAVIMRNDRES